MAVACRRRLVVVKVAGRGLGEEGQRRRVEAVKVVVVFVLGNDCGRIVSGRVVLALKRRERMRIR